MKRLSLVFVLVLVSLASRPVMADQCDSNYKSGGSLFRGGKTYETFVDYSTVDPITALDRLAKQLPKDDFTIESIDQSTGTIKALAKISANKTAPVEISATPFETGTRVRFSIALPPGVMGNASTKYEICRYVAFAQIDPAKYHAHPLAEFVRVNSTSQDKVSVVESSGTKRATKVVFGALIGATAGALHAKLTGGDVGKEAAIGAVAGGTITFAVTHFQDKRLANRDETVKTVSYDPAQGYRAGVSDVSVTPASVKAGGTITVVTTYWALAPTASVSFGMSRFAGIGISGIYLRGFTFNPQPFQFGDGGGQYQTTMEIHLPDKVSPGQYTVQWVLDGQATTGDNQAMFTVTG
jgi:uncharacterized protein YcfJ